jgi:protocatechuate 3,4-dioxygenase beta subunit
VSGRVLGPDGKPFAGARLFVVTRGAKKNDLTVQATTGEDGRFSVSVPRSDFERQAKLVAAAGGHGPAWVEVAKRPAGPLTLRLVKDDVPITGRVLDLEGKPVEGASVTVAWVDEVDLKPWLKDRAKNHLFASKSLATVAFDGPASVKTDEKGRFSLRGFGRDRVAHLFVRGPGLEDTDVEVIARAGPVEGLRVGYREVYPADARFTIGPSKPIVGTVRDKKTGMPISGIRVVVPGRTWNWSGATTDEKGRYRVEGAAKRKDYTVAAGGMPYFNSTKMNVPDTEGLNPITVDFDLERGVVVKGRLTDRATGKPVRGRVNYIALDDNPNRKDFTDLGKPQAIAVDLGRTDDEGRFTVIAIPGPGLLCARADDADRFLRAQPAPGHKTIFILEHYHAVVPINVSEKDPKSLTYEVALDSGRTVTGLVVGPDGKPLAGSHAAGLSPVFAPSLFEQRKLGTASFKVGGLAPPRPRAVVFFHQEKKLARVQRFEGDEKGPVTVRLEPLAALAGRLLDADGKPAAGLKVTALISVQREDYKELPVDLLYDYPSWSKLTNGEATTDKEGRFRIEGLVPGLKYLINVKDGSEILPAYTREVPSLETGKAADLGDLKARPAPGKGKE